MKKYLWAVFILVAGIVIYQYVQYQSGLIFHVYEIDEINSNVITKDNQIYVNGELFQVKSVQMSASMPNYRFSDYAADQADYMRWMKDIHEMGANTIHVSTLMDDDFYNALYEFNQGHKDQPLYLFQGVRVSDYGNNTPFDAYDSEFYDILKQDLRSAIDIVHGKKNILLNRGRGLGTYRKDISSWVLGYQIGDSWNNNTVAYTNHNHNTTQFSGTYVKTDKDANAFEALLASLMDDGLRYEGEKYGRQSLISFINDPGNDPFAYDGFYAGQLSKTVQIDVSHILPTDALKSGIIASYHMFEVPSDFMTYFSEDTKKTLKNEISQMNPSHYLNGYVDLLNAYYDVPVLISNYGFSSARGSDTKESLDEKAQGKALMETYDDFMESGCAGAIIHHWQDEWGNRTWNTNYAVNVDESIYWDDIQSMNHGYGLLAFDPGKEKRKVYIDGIHEEWEEDDVVYINDGLKLSMKQDEQGIYFFIHGNQDKLSDHLILPIDITSESGSRIWKDHETTFERPADFILELEGIKAQMLVQSRYESLRENFLSMIDGEDPFIYPPKKDDSAFVAINMIQKKMKIRENVTNSKPVYSEVKETGKLIYGNGNPESKDYYSLSDFMIGKDGIEIRIPWQLLNFSNPANLEIHQDYYEHYGVETKTISKLYVGLGTINDKQIPMQDVTLKRWNKAETHERKKQSYDIVKEAWRKQP